MSIVLIGSTSGSCTLQEQAIAGTSVLTLPVGTGTVVANNVNSAIVSGTAVTASGTSVDFTGIPSWVRRITVNFSGVSTNGTSNYLIQLGDSGGIETAGYLGASNDPAGATYQNYTNGIGVISVLAANVWHGSIVISLIGSNNWAASYVLCKSNNFGGAYGGFSKTLSDVLTQVRITTVNGTDAFDAGTINILYE
jgi:hypothetical protein